MAEKKYYIGSRGPFLYDDTEFPAAFNTEGTIRSQTIPSDGSDVVRLDDLGGIFAPGDSSYVVIALDGDLSAERVLAVNTTNLSLTDGGANGNITIDTVQDIDTTATPEFTGLTLSAIPAGEDNSVLVSVGGVLSIDEIDSRVWGSSLVDYSGTPTAGHIPYFTDADTIAMDEGQLFWDASSHRLGLGTAMPRFHMHLHEPSSGFVYTNYTNTTTGSIANRGVSFGMDAQEVGLIWQYMDNHIRFGTANVERLRIKNNGNVGIGTATIPHGGIGAAKLAIEGANANDAGPHVQLTTASDDYPLLQILAWAHDAVHLLFDTSFRTAVGFISSDAGSNAMISKKDDKLIIKYDSGVAQGGNVAFNDGIVLDLTNGDVGINEPNPDEKLEVNGNVHITGDTYWTGDGSGVPYGSMYNNNTLTGVSITDTTPVRIPSGFLVGQLNLATFSNSREITVTKAGRYKIDWSISFHTDGGSNQEIEGGIGIDNVYNVQGTAHRFIGTATDKGNIGGTAILDLAASKVVSLMMVNDTDSQNIIVSHASLSLMMVGGT